MKIWKLKGTITKIENSKDVFNSRLDTAEKITSELENVKVENSRTMKSLILSYLQVSFASFMNPDRKYETPGSEIKGSLLQ